MTNLEEVVWAQEEPKNQGYWTHVEPRIERRLGEAGLKPKRPIYAGREPAASPATGLAKRHAAEQAALIADALGHSSAGAARSAKPAKGIDMATEVKVPTLGESITEATLGQWLKQPGDAVAPDEPIASLETDKVAVEVPAPVAGTMGEQLRRGRRHGRGRRGDRPDRGGGGLPAPRQGRSRRRPTTPVNPEGAGENIELRRTTTPTTTRTGRI